MGDSLLPTLPAVTRGDVFTQPEDDYRFYDYHETKYNTKDLTQTESPSRSSDLRTSPEATSEPGPILKPTKEAPVFEASNPTSDVVTSGAETTGQVILASPAEEELCSGKPFDAFTNLKNGSIFAFRGDSKSRSWRGGGLPQEHLSLTQLPPL